MIRTATLVLIMAGAVLAANTGEEDMDRLLSISDLPMHERQQAAERFLAHRRSHPYTHHGPSPEVIVYSGPGRDVRLVGDFTDWQPRIRMKHIQGTNLWYYETSFPADARIDYKFVRDGEWILDPLNPYTCMSGFGPNSVFRGVDYRLPPFAVGNRMRPGQCSLDTLHVETPQLGGSRKVVVVTPPGIAGPNRRYLLVHDGLEYLSLAELDEAMAWAAKSIDPSDLPICVCVPPGRRTEEYATSLQDDFSAFIVDTLIPLIEERYGARGPWGVMGPSYGGRISVHLAHTYPHLFDRVAAMSPSVTDHQIQRVAQLDPAAVRFYVNWGTYDIQRLIPGCERFVKMLADKGFEHMVEVKPQGHSWGFWRDSLIPALAYLYGQSP